MLSIGKLGRGAEGYYLAAVARGVEDYYVGVGEAPGVWGCGGAARLGVSGQVQGDALAAVLDGRHPGTGADLLAMRQERRVPGFDLTFSAPKSVSLLWALGDAQLTAAVREAHDRAVRDAMGYLERTVSHVRRGRDGWQRLPSGGFVAATFRHRTSRAGDPQLHNHVLVANLAQGSDGRWSAVDGYQLYRHAKTAGTLYQAALRHQLRHLGVQWRLRDNGQAEIAGVPEAVLGHFSQRRAEIETELQRVGLSSRAAAQTATLATRRTKPHPVDGSRLVEVWRQRADRIGFTFERLRSRHIST